MPGLQVNIFGRNDIMLWAPNTDRTLPMLIIKQGCGPLPRQELVTEVAAYKKLQFMQGSVPGIPVLKSSGRHAQSAELYVLVEQHAGYDTGVTVSQAEWSAAVPDIWTVFNLMWEAGVVHGDVARRNVVFDTSHKPPRVCIIDFGRAKLGATCADIEKERARVHALCR